MQKRANRRTLVMAASKATVLAGLCLLLSPSVKPSAALAQTVAFAQQQGSGPQKRLGIRLRTFVPNARGSLYFEPSLSGGKVRLTALGLPPSEELMPDGRAFLIWAVTAGLPPVRVGELKVDVNGNGGLEFERPAALERYSIIITAETSAMAERPLGVIVMASNAGAVSAFFGKSPDVKANRRLGLELGRRVRSKQRANDFFKEVDNALNQSPGGGRVLELFGEELAPQGHALARVTSLNEWAYVRAVMTKVPLPSEVGASTYILWTILPGGQIIYSGSLPTASLNDTDIYVRVGGVNKDNFDLFVTAEARRPVARPSSRRVLSSQSENVAQFGAIEGQVLDAQGRPLAGAKVDGFPLQGQRDAGVLPTTFTDQNGKFFLDGVMPGTHLISASKEEEGYPSTFFAFFVVDPKATSEVTVYNQQVTEGVLLRLGPKAAKLVGQIVDAQTGRPVNDAEMVLSRVDNPNHRYSIGPNRGEGRFERLVPPVAFKLKVSARGYEEWNYGKDSNGEAQYIQIAPDGRMELLIRLQPSKTSQK
jgi:hypothetical protein